MSRRKALAVCAKSGCPTLTMNSYCDSHKPKAWASSKRKDALTLNGSQRQKRRKRILAAYLNCCHLCGGVFPDHELEVDHRQPLAEGGADEDANCAPACLTCHRAKSAAESKRAREWKAGGA